MALMVTSSLVVLPGLGLGWWIYGNKSPRPKSRDALEKAMPPVWGWLRDRLYVDELYDVTVIAFYAGGRGWPTGLTAVSGADWSPA